MSSILAADPARLRTAAARLGATSSHLSSCAAHVAGAAHQAEGWIGEAADMYRIHVTRLASDVNTGSSAMGRAAQVLATLAAELEVAQQMAREAQAFGSSATSLRSQAASMESSPATRMMLEEAYAIDHRAASLAFEAEQLARAAGLRAAEQLNGISVSAPSQQDSGWAGVLDLDRHDLDAYLNMSLAGLPLAVRETTVQQHAQLTAPEPEERDQADDGCLDTLTCLLQTAQIMTAPIADAMTGGSTIETRELLGQDYVDEGTRGYGLVHATTNVASIIVPGPKLTRGAKYLKEMLRYGDSLANPVRNAILETPTVSNTRLRNIIKDLYKGTTKAGRIGTGTTADAIRYELLTGKPVHGRFHSDKGEIYARALEKLLKRRQNLSDHDRLVAQSLYDDLKRALKGQL